MADTGNYRIQQFSGSGAVLQQLGSLGGGDGQFFNPMGIAIDASRKTIWVSDSGSNRVQKFSVTGFTPGVAPPVTFQSKIGAANTGNVWVADSRNQRAVGISSGGTLLATSWRKNERLSPLPSIRGAAQFCKVVQIAGPKHF